MASAANKPKYKAWQSLAGNGDTLLLKDTLISGDTVSIAELSPSFNTTYLD